MFILLIISLLRTYKELKRVNCLFNSFSKSFHVYCVPTRNWNKICVLMRRLVCNRLLRTYKELKLHKESLSIWNNVSSLLRTYKELKLSSNSNMASAISSVYCVPTRNWNKGTLIHCSVFYKWFIAYLQGIETLPNNQSYFLSISLLRTYKELKQI